MEKKYQDYDKVVANVSNYVNAMDKVREIVND